MTTPGMGEVDRAGSWQSRAAYGAVAEGESGYNTSLLIFLKGVLWRRIALMTLRPVSK